MEVLEGRVRVDNAGDILLSIFEIIKLVRSFVTFLLR